MRAERGETGRRVPGAGEAGAPAPPRPAPPARPLLAFAELRARLALRRFRGRGGIVELVARIVLFGVAVPAGLAFATLAAVGAWQAVRSGDAARAEIAAAALLFGVWQTWTAVSLSLSERETLDLRRFLAYPIPSGRVYAYGLVASAVGDPFSVFWSLLVGGAFVGAALARPGPWILLLAAAYVLFVAGTVAFVAFLQELLARVLRGRRVREVAIAAVYVGTAFLVVFMAGGARPAAEALRALALVRWVAFPPALAERTVSALYAGRPGAALPWLALSIVATALCGLAAYRLALAAARGGGDEGPRAAARGRDGWRLPGRLGPLLEKELKYLLRHPVSSVLALVVPAFSALVAWKLSPRIPSEAGQVVRALPLFAFVLYAHLATQPFWLNAFGWERGGGRTFFLAPVSPGDVVFSKNVAAYLLSFALFAASTGAGVAAGGAPPAWALAGAVALHAGIAPYFLVAGNLVSILNPRPASHTLQRGGHLSPVAALAGMAVFSAGVAVFSVPVLAGIRLDDGWVLPAGWAALGLVGLALYLATLPRLARLLRERREPLLAALCGDDA